jgi:Ran-binding protein 1
MSTPNKTDPPANPFAAFGNLASGPLLFGSSGSTGEAPKFSFNASMFGASASGTKKESTPKKDDEDDEDDGDDADDDAAAVDESHAQTEFTPLVTLEKIEVKSMEEDEEAVFKSRAKLYVFVKEDKYGDEVRTNWWRERGLGEIKIMKHKTTNECRLLMRQEKTLKICLNHKISPQSALTAQGVDGKAWTFPAIDFADGEAKQDLFALKLPNPDVAKDFQKHFEEAKKFNEKLKAAGGASPAKAAAPASPVIKSTPAAVATPASPAKPPVAAPLASTQTPKQSNASAEASKPPTFSSFPGAIQGSKPASASVETISHQVGSMNVASSGAAAEPLRVGGYQKRNPEEAEVKKVAEFALGKINQGDLVKVASVKSQVVAGMNYRMALHVRHRTGGVFAHVVTVYQPLPHMNQPLSMTDHVVTGQIA